MKIKKSSNKMILHIRLIVIFVACIATPVLPQFQLRPQQLQIQQPAQLCITPENSYGTCVMLSYCPEVANAYQTANRRQVQQYVILSQRACNTRSINGDPVVCCTRPRFATQNTERLIPPTTINNPFLPNTPQQTQMKRPNIRPPTIVTQFSTRPPIIVTQPPTRSPTTATRPPTSEESLVDNNGSTCNGPDTLEGRCIPIEECQILLDELQVKQTDEKFQIFLRASHSICGGTGTNVCCPSRQTRTTTNTRFINSSNEIPRRLPTIDEGCGFGNNPFKKIVGGKVSRKGAWPWIALIGYGGNSSASPFKCGGTLITARHVITAAHCVKDDLSFVRLGEHDLTTETETPHVDIRVVRSEKHQDFNKRNGHSDIAILYLERNVEFSDIILPICMPATPEYRQKSYIEYVPFVVGWGKTMEGGSSANILQELQIPVYDNQVCRESYRQQSRLFTNNQFDNAVLCAGVLSGGKDTCQGDSGGPLMVPEASRNGVHFYLIGVVSYGIGCARAEIPGVYASTQYFMDWIIQKVADTP